MTRKYNAEKATKAIKAAALMPPLTHNTPSQDFDVSKSEVVLWLRSQPDILNAMFGYYKDRGAIVFDQESGMWRGVEFK